MTPVGESGGAVELETVSAVETALLVEMILDGRMNGGEFLQTSHLSEAKHRAGTVRASLIEAGDAVA